MAVRHPAFLLVFLVALPVFLPAQSERAPVLDTAVVRQLRPQRLIRVQMGPARLAGRFQRITAGDMILLDGDEVRRISLGEVDRLWVRGRRTTLGAVIGGILGAGGGVFLGLIADGLCETSCDHSAVVPLGLLGAGAGAVTGGLIGAVIPRWRKVFPP